MDSFDPTLISVVMPCHNAAPYVEEAMASVLGQSYPHIELVVVDDGSTDGSEATVERIADAHRHFEVVAYGQMLVVRKSFQESGNVLIGE